MALSGRDAQVRRGLVLIVCCVTLAGCGLIGGSSKKTASSTTTIPLTIPTTTTSTIPPPSIEVRPTSGPIGTSFQLIGTRFQPGEAVIFEIDPPPGKAPFKGPAHKAAADGMVTTTYRVTAGNPLGTWQVKATGDKGTQAAGQFDVTDGTGGTGGTGTSTTLASRTTTTRARTTTTVRSTTTTTKKP